MSAPKVHQLNAAVYRRRETCKSGEVTLTTRVDGEIPHTNDAGLGLYYQDTRFLSCWETRLNHCAPLNLFATSRLNCRFLSDLTNPGMRVNGQTLPMHTVHLRVARVISHDVYQRMRIVNFNPFPVDLQLRMTFAADFADMFEVRDVKRTQRGQYLAPRLTKRSITFHYRGRDHVVRETRVVFQPGPATIRRVAGQRVEAVFDLHLSPKEPRHFLRMRVSPCGRRKARPVRTFERALAQTQAMDRSWKRANTQITVDNDVYQQIVHQSENDMHVLTTRYASGSIPVAGLPWYDCPFGRDSLIASWQTLMLRPELAVNTLRFLAKYQGQETNAWRDEQPGKILHELRFGEMASAGEIPHTPYYGTIDATLLFIMLLGVTDHWMHDLEVLRSFEPALRRALAWIDESGDLDGDGFVEYQRLSSRGLANQGWKDSHDGILDEHGRDPKPPIALVEIQAYTYKAYGVAATILQRLHDPVMAQEYVRKAQRLQRRFLEVFWSRKRRELAYGLDGSKRPFFANVSNVGHVLMSGLLPSAMARDVIHRLMKPEMHSGWGIRTRSNTEPAYNPMSYHNGSVWPHDNGIIAVGLRRYGALQELDKLVTGLFDAAVRMEYRRLPELFCGFVRRRDEAPVIYPSACTPQAWAAGCTFQLLQAMLGIRAEAGQLIVQKPILPHWLREVQLKQLRVGRGTVDLSFERLRRGRVQCHAVRTRGGATVHVQR